jgi:hypothetical protein
MPKRKFVAPADETLAKYREIQHAPATNYSTVSAENALREFYNQLPCCSTASFYNDLEAQEMNLILEKFYITCKTINERDYKASSLRAMRHSLNRAVRSSHKFDIIHDHQFITSNVVFNNRLKDLKKSGFGSTDHHPDIISGDLRKIVQGLSPDRPDELQLLVWFYLQLHFCKRGMENSISMEKSHFGVVSKDGKRCVVQLKDEMTKNHRENDSSRSNGAVIPEQNHAKCPVALFEKYVLKLDPKSKFMWQLPLKTNKLNGPSWYKGKCGKKLSQNS